MNLRDASGITTPSGSTLANSPESNWLEVRIWVDLSDRYGLFADISHQIQVDVKAHTQYSLQGRKVTLSFPSSFDLEEVYPKGIPYSISYTSVYASAELEFRLPTDSQTFSFGLKGSVPSTSLFWRDSAEIPSFYASSNFAQPTCKYFIASPQGSTVQTMYSEYSNVKYDYEVVEGRSYLTGDFTGAHTTSILYDSQVRGTYVLAALATTISAAVLSSYFLRAELTGTVGVIMGMLRRLHRSTVKHVDSNKLLVLFLICALLMVSLSLTFGPDPRVKVFVYASPASGKSISEAISIDEGRIALTLQDTRTEITTLANVGALNTVVFADFETESQGFIDDNIRPVLSSARWIILLKEYNGTLADEIAAKYPDKVLKTDMTNLKYVLSQDWVVSTRSNVFGLKVDVESFIFATALIAIMSFVLVALGTAFLASKLIDIGRRPGFGGVPEVFSFVIFYFVFTEAIYMACSALLAVPLGMHAVTSGSANVTALGLLGLGGGSRPRLLAGCIGFLLGAFVGTKDGVKIDRMVLIGIVALGVFLVLDPLTGGVLLHEFLLFFSIGPGFETAVSAKDFINMFMEQVGVTYGAWASPTYALSRGIMLYYFGAIPFFLFPKIGRKTATVLLFASAVLVGQGGIRVAEMTPWKALVGIIPGLVVGLGLTVAFILISRLEFATSRTLMRIRSRGRDA